MAYYQRRRQLCRRSGTPSIATRAGRALRRGADGRGGVLLRLLPALPPGLPSAVVDATPWELPDQSRRRTGHCCRGTSSCTSSSRVRTGRRSTPSPGGGWCWATATCGSPTSSRARRARSTATRSATSASTSSPAPPPSRRSSARCRRARATTCCCRGPPRTAGCPRAKIPSRLYVIEANSHIAPPKRYLSRFGQFLEHSPYCERDLHGPAEPLLVEGEDVELLVKHRGARGITGTRYVVPTHPFDVVGWDGCLYPYTFNVADFEPITGRVHQPPPVHQVFEGHNFVICNFVPRKVDYHPLPYRCPTTISTSTPTRSCSTSTATTKPARAPASARARSACTQEGTATVRSPARWRTLARRAVLRRAGGHGRHLPAPGTGRGRPRQRGPDILVELGRTRAGPMTSAHVPVPHGVHG